ncbi:MAG: TRAM domain-containing protein, partial [Elusimicrobiota bacterium]|nr:TRAM domain-containing protein [Elusimicrobiota bacterium]
MFQLDDIVEVKIEQIANGGEGVGRVNNFVIFVPFSAVGDVLDVKIVKLSKTFA